MGFKVSASDLKEITEYLTRQCPGSSAVIYIEPNESKMFISAVNKRSEPVTIEVSPEDVSAFPKLTKAMRLKDDV